MPIPLPSFVGLIGSSDSSSSNFRSVFCGSFNGVDQRLQTGNPFASSTDNYDYPDSDFTISAWIKPTFTTISRVGNSTVIAGFGSYSAGKLRALTIVNGKLGFNFWATGAGEEGSAISRDDWHHVVATFDSSGNLKLYLDGVIQSDGMSLGSNPVGQGEAFIGGSNSLGAANFEYFHGHIDEVAVFNSVLSAGQVEDIYNLGQPSDLNSFSEIPSLWWRIDVSEDTSWATSEVPANGVGIKACSDRHWPRSSGKPLGPNMDSWGYNNAPFFSEEVPVGRVISPVTITVSSEAPSTYKYTTSDSNGNGGLFGSIDVVRGETLTINVVGDDVELVTHPLKITNFNNLGQEEAPLTGVVKTMLNPDGPTRDETYSLTWTVPCDATISQYQYQCENHAGMRGAINVSGSCVYTCTTTSIVSQEQYSISDEISGYASAFNGNVTGTQYHHGWYAYNNGYVSTGSIGQSFPSPQVITQYKMHPWAGSARSVDAKSWVFEASNDNFTTAVTLDTQDNQIFSANTWREFSVVNTSAYLQYRLRVTENNGSSTLVVQEVQFLGCDISGGQ